MLLSPADSQHCSVLAGQKLQFLNKLTIKLEEINLRIEPTLLSPPKLRSQTAEGGGERINLARQNKILTHCGEAWQSRWMRCRVGSSSVSPPTR